MIEITYLDAVKQERLMQFESYQDFEQSQQACLIGVADYYPVKKLTYKDHDMKYQGTYTLRKSNSNYVSVALL